MRSNKTWRRTWAMALLIPMAFAVQAAVDSPLAEARCAGTGVLVNSTLDIGGTSVVSERPFAGTCDNNGLYQSYYQSYYPGYRASVWIQNGGVWHGSYGAAYDTQTYSFSYSHSPSYSYITICRDSGIYWSCGFGSQVASSTNGPNFTYYGILQGY